MKINHDWRTLIPSNDPRHVKRGSEIEVSIPKGEPFRSRFAIYSVRVTGWEKDPMAPNGGYLITDATYRVRDAETVSDAQVKSGDRPKIVFEAPTLDQVEAFILGEVSLMMARAH